MTAHAEAERYYALIARADALGIPTSLDDPSSPATVAELEAAVAELELDVFEVVLPNGDRAEAESADAIVRASQVLVAEAARAGCSSAWLRRELFVVAAGRYDAALTARARS